MLSPAKRSMSVCRRKQPAGQAWGGQWQRWHCAAAAAASDCGSQRASYGAEHGIKRHGRDDAACVYLIVLK